jgi:Arc/MetJ-type ribon-helix-helix transcriptional regulator
LLLRKDNPALQIRRSIAVGRTPGPLTAQAGRDHFPQQFAFVAGAHSGPLLPYDPMLYGECMARRVSTTVRLDEEDVRALKRARAAGVSASDLIRRGLRVVASRYYSGRRPPSTLLFESTNSKLGDESELFRDIED